MGIIPMGGEKAQFLRNALVGGGMHFVIVISGFIIPRLINDSLGQNALGIWDLSWAALQYVAMGSLGIEGALSRWVSYLNASREIDRLPQFITTAFFWQSLIAIVAIVLFFIFAWALPDLIELSSAEEYEQARCVLVIMGLALSLKLLGNIPGAIITGCHRFDIQYSIEGAQDLALAILLVSILWLGADLTDLTCAVLVLEMFAAVTRLYFSRKVCRNVKLRLREGSVAIGKEMLVFGLKNIIVNVPQIIIIQTTAIMVAIFSGPAVLSVLNRAMALLRFIEKLVRKICFQFMPLASDYMGAGKVKELGLLVIRSGQLGLALTLPFSILLFFFGDQVLLLWMGEAFANETLMKILVLGTFFPIAQIGVVSVFTGMNQHGKLAIVGLVSTGACMMIMLPIATFLGWSAVIAAATLGLVWSIGRFVSVVVVVRGILKMSLKKYFYQTLCLPAACNLPVILCLYFGDRYLADWGYMPVFFLAGFGCLWACILYWVVLLDLEMREALKKGIRQRLSS